MIRRTLLYASVFALFAPECIYAHAFGQQYTLPLPFSLYVTCAASALLASFAILGLFSMPQQSSNLPAAHLVWTFPRSRSFNRVAQGIGVTLLALTIFTAFWGSHNYLINPVPILFWIGVLLVFTYVSALIGGLARYLNPFETITRAVLANHESVFVCPAWLGVWPALVSYIGFISLELLSSGLGAAPTIIGNILVAYLLISISGAYLFGVRDWFEHADFFNVFLGIVGRFAPLHYRDNTLVLTIPGERLIVEKPEHISVLYFILFMLSSTAFDGLQETQAWWEFFLQILIHTDFFLLERFLILVASPIIFFALFSLVIMIMKVLTDSHKSVSELLLRFAYSLVPIAIAYNVAHYFSLVLIEGQTLITLVSDPLALGWNLFGTAGFVPNKGLIDADTVWYIQFSAILVGHIIATYVSHRIALREFSTKQRILIGQVPMLFLMIFYTIFGLWILTQALQV